ncbi:hypothetical protein ABG79_02102 [Caloramator mitchellensis]|uniref:Uncharacterized protein n=1 Tax=Caloramator mitchellensis TaxID=908809 RepID=A0A0R3JRN8_CALMK|nr:hypothetical protein [Caloramator mitchellensis]KRQ86150.1 hypothetical protein ABG79_02102 [Caloramator mitchellensis]
MENYDNLKELFTRLEYYAIDNLFWTLFYSGCGLPYFFSEKEISYLNSFGDEDKEFIENLMPIRCLYKKAKAVFSEAPHEILNAGKYVWDFESFDKEISVQTQVFAVLSMMQLLNYNKFNNKLFKYVSNRQIKNFIDFLTAYMRNKDGLFVDVVDKTRYLNEELKIKQQKDLRLINQFFALEAMLSYSKFVEINNNQIYNSEANSIFKYIFENFNFVLDLTTREVCLIASSLYRASSMAQDDAMITSMSELIALCCAEIESRIKINGEIEKSSNNYSPSSLVTHFRAISALLEGYKQTRIEKFKHSAKRIADFLIDLFDEDIMLFNTFESEYKYTIRDISEIIKALLLLRDVLDDEMALEVLKKFVEASIENSGIVQSVTEEKFKDDTKSLFSDVNLAPVFLRSFTFKRDLLSKYEVSSSVNLYYSVYASYLMLMSISALDKFLEEKKLAYNDDLNENLTVSTTAEEDKIPDA